MVLSDKWYKILKWSGLIITNGLAAFWLTIAKLWNIPYGVEIGATITAIGVLIGVIVKISDGHYEGDGTMIVNTTDPSKDVYTLEYNGDLNEIAAKKSVTFVVSNPDAK